MTDYWKCEGNDGFLFWAVHPTCSSIITTTVHVGWLFGACLITVMNVITEMQEISDIYCACCNESILYWHFFNSLLLKASKSLIVNCIQVTVLEVPFMPEDIEALLTSNHFISIHFIHLWKVTKQFQILCNQLEKTPN